MGLGFVSVTVIEGRMRLWWTTSLMQQRALALFGFATAQHIHMMCLCQQQPNRLWRQDEMWRTTSPLSAGLVVQSWSAAWAGSASQPHHTCLDSRLWRASGLARLWGGMAAFYWLSTPPAGNRMMCGFFPNGCKCPVHTRQWSWVYGSLKAVGSLNRRCHLLILVPALCRLHWVAHRLWQEMQQQSCKLTNKLGKALTNWAATVAHWKHDYHWGADCWNETTCRKPLRTVYTRP